MQTSDNKVGKLGKTIQVRLVSNLTKSLEYYRDVLGCHIDGWGHAERDEMTFILQQANSPNDVRPNACSQKHLDYPTEWEGPKFGWDTYVHVSWDDLDSIVAEIRHNGGNVAVEPYTSNHGPWEEKITCIKDPDGYNIVLGSMRETK
ncbi:VOC family protein [Metabacillus malikii]|uniref:Enzyme related to lactoylglutathione lyase n=1 Tax=Metabacillus malikii TaxID=1504265 RepID=A0ABT9ZEY3_9BACI|nr:VOC family protein [Metabacillus malikii]MDQ0230133.1 putative enzyme related to lactoylglutathione lyase [Metabacillus malikii]